MNCPQAREHLPDLLYRALAPEVAAQVTAHLAGCADCRVEHTALKQVLHALDTAPPPVPVAVDLPRLYRAAIEKQERRFRRWRRVAIVCAGLAAALVLFAVLPSFEFRCETHQFVVRWGAPPSVPQPAPLPTPPPLDFELDRTQFVAVTAPDVEERLNLLSDLVQMLVKDADSRDLSRRRDLETLRAQLTELRQQSQQWRLSTERDVAALYAVQFPDVRKGKQP